MDKNKIEHLVEQVFKSWTASQVKVLSCYTHSIRIQVLSDDFAGLSLEARLARVKQQIAQTSDELNTSFIWSIQPYTFTEASRLPTLNTDEEDFSSNQSLPKRAASSEADL